ncbi:MAG: hemerythrin domain-containing protein [Chloroflexota bacterium]|nr:hemerythrin domain-containing protein [Chloroflexota bacterium]
METIDTLMDEHTGILMVLDQAEIAAAAAATGQAVPKDVFTDIQDFFAVFVDKCHHGKEEDELFPLLARAGERGIADRLLEEHTEGRALAAAYAAAVDAYAPGNAAAGSKVEDAVEAYSSFLRRHIGTETGELFPAVERRLYNSDEVIAQAFERLEVQKIGAGTHERLHHMIEGLGARISPWT